MDNLDKESLRQKSESWDLITDLLDKLDPDWLSNDKSGQQSALDAIYKIASERDALREEMQNAREQEAENDRIKSENARLQSVIDEANAQESCGYQIFSSVHGWVTADEDTFNLRVVDNFAPVRKIYARPIPAQQSGKLLGYIHTSEIDNTGSRSVLLSDKPDEFGISVPVYANGAQQSPSWKLGKMNDSGKIVEQSPVSQDYNFIIPLIHFARQIKPQVNLPEQDRLIESMQSELEKVQEYIRNNHKQSPAEVPADCLSPTVASSRRYGQPTERHMQSPAVEVHDDWNAQCNCGHRWHAAMPTENCQSCNPSPRITDNPTELEMHRADYKSIKSAGFESPGELLAAYNHLLSNRVTDQDAREIINSAFEYEENLGRFKFDKWLRRMGRSILGKLNGAKNAQ